MKLSDALVVLGTAHRLREPGKQSPDGRLREAVYSRQTVGCLAAKLSAMGCRVMVDYEPLDLPKAMQSPSARVERQRELAMRVNLVNEVCRQQGAGRVLYVSVHVNASGSDGQWHSPCGWQVCVGTKASERSRRLAGCLYDAAKAHGLKMRQPAPGQRYWPQQLYVLNGTLCPAVLTENLFQDHLGDVDFLLSDEGRHAIERLHVEGIIRYIESL